MDLHKIVLGYNKNTMFINVDKNLQLCEIQKMPMQLTLKDIHNQLKTMRFDIFYQSTGGMDNKNWELENAKLIPFNFLYYYLFVTEQKVPTPQKLVCEYIYRFCKASETHPHQYTLKDHYVKLGYGEKLLFTIEAIAGRICRAYNSFNREVELAFRLMQEEELSVRYSFKEDYFNGIDLGVVCNNIMCGIACYQDNPRTEAFKVLKETTRRHNYDGSKMIPMKIDKNNHNVCGDIWIFSDKEYQELLQKIYNKSEKG